MSRIFALMVLTEDDKLIHIPCKSHEAMAKAKKLKEEEAKNDYKAIFVTEMKRKYKCVSKSQMASRAASLQADGQRVLEAQRNEILKKLSKSALKEAEDNDVDILVFADLEKVSVKDVKDHIKSLKKD